MLQGHLREVFHNGAVGLVHKAHPALCTAPAVPLQERGGHAAQLHLRPLRIAMPREWAASVQGHERRSRPATLLLFAWLSTWPFGMGAHKYLTHLAAVLPVPSDDEEAPVLQLAHEFKECLEQPAAGSADVADVACAKAGCPVFFTEGGTRSSTSAAQCGVAVQVATNGEGQRWMRGVQEPGGARRMQGAQA